MIPINTTVLQNMLKQSNHEENKTRFIVNGFSEGFDIGYSGPKIRADEANNIPLRIGSQTEMWNKLMKEIQHKRLAGPFTREELPFTSYIQSPIGLVPKAGNGTRLIFHLSFDFGGTEEGKSVNHHTPHELCTVKYKDLDSAIHGCIQLIKQTGLTQLFYSKSDCPNAFRLLPVKIAQRCWLLSKMKHPITKVLYFFIDKCLPFGASISCALFQKFSDCLHHLASWKIRLVLYIEPCITNYLDDFLFVAVTIILCNQMLGVFIQVCGLINCPLSEDKTEWATQLIVFLGMLLNGRTLTISIPKDKKRKAEHLINNVMTNKK